MEFTIKELLWGAGTPNRVDLPSRRTCSCAYSEESIEFNAETSLPSRHHDTLPIEERCSSISLQRWSCRHRLQPLVPSWIAWYLESTPICSSCYVKIHTWNKSLVFSFLFNLFFFNQRLCNYIGLEGKYLSIVCWGKLGEAETTVKSLIWHSIALNWNKNIIWLGSLIM